MYGKEAMEAMNDHPIEDAFHSPDISVSPEEDEWIRERWGTYDEPDPVVAANIRRLSERSAEGMKKYGTTMMRDDLTSVEWIDHAIEEALDFANYLERLKYDLLKGTK